MKLRIKKLEEAYDGFRVWREHIDSELASAQKQLRKLFATVDDHARQSKESNEQMSSKLDSIMKSIQDLGHTDEKHEERLTKANHEREDLRVAVEEIVGEAIKSKGLPDSGKKLYSAAGAAGVVGSVIMALIANLPEISEALIHIMRETK